MIDSKLNRSVCVDCGSDNSTERHRPDQCAPCEESTSRRLLRLICPLCRGRCELPETMSFADGHRVKVVRVCHECGGTGEQIWPR